MRILYSVCITLAVLYAGCSNKAGQSENAETGSSTSDTTQYAVGDTLRFSGTLIDTHCYSLDRDNIGDDHTLPKSGFREDCAAYCANLGYPVGVLLNGKKGNKVWIMRFSSQVFADYMAEQVRVQAEFISDGLAEPFKVEMKTEDGWTRII